MNYSDQLAMLVTLTGIKMKNMQSVTNRLVSACNGLRSSSGDPDISCELINLICCTHHFASCSVDMKHVFEAIFYVVKELNLHPDPYSEVVDLGVKYLNGQEIQFREHLERSISALSGISQPKTLADHCSTVIAEIEELKLGLATKEEYERIGGLPDHMMSSD